VAETNAVIRELILCNRSYRRFRADVAVGRETLRGLVDLARQSASARNLQPLKYVLVCEPERTAAVFPLLAWAGYLADWAGPEPAERPAAYIVVLGDTRIGTSFGYDAGIAVQSILLGAVAEGLGGCILASVRREELRSLLAIPSHCEILLVVAIGEPAETVQLEALAPGGSIAYWRDPAGVHHVPKRSLDEIILG
jgi:nitroreductase